ncbi:unnamed protein product [Callosobruchus maculatus]|uniref:Uncharacterized protein n=1 Tax=Callosobruchus maculatus TaxID=64391 RepID=A0A653D634_CALMS|nr:unnamed protein product [Callosobruchus maculatus]
MKLALLTAVFLAFQIPEGRCQRNRKWDMDSFYKACYSPKPFVHFLALWKFISNEPENYEDPKFESLYAIKAQNAIKSYPKAAAFLSDNNELRKWLQCMKATDTKLNEKAQEDIQPFIERQLFCIRDAMDKFILHGTLGSFSNYTECYATKKMCKPKTLVHGG